MDDYNRHAPKLAELLDRLKEYEKITYGRPAYPLSKAEASLLLDTVYRLNPSSFIVEEGDSDA